MVSFLSGTFHAYHVELSLWMFCCIFYKKRAWFHYHLSELLWVFKYPICEKVLSHKVQEYGLIPVWIFSWEFRLDEFLNVLLHILQENDLIPLWTRICLFRPWCVVNDFMHKSHWYDSWVASFDCWAIPIWVLICRRSWSDVLKLSVQIWQQNCPSWKWFNSWLFKLLLSEKDFSHRLQESIDMSSPIN